jgi:phage tail-like protein
MSYYPPTGFFFSVTIPGGNKDDASFQEVDGISMEMEIEKIESGGESHRHYMVPKAVKYSNLVLSRGIIVANSPFAKWCMDSMQSGLMNKIEPKSVSVKLLDPEDSSSHLAGWIFHNAYPVKWSVSKFNAQQAEILMENIELTYSYFDYQPKG